MKLGPHLGFQAAALAGQAANMANPHGAIGWLTLGITVAQSIIAILAHFAPPPGAEKKAK